MISIFLSALSIKTIKATVHNKSINIVIIVEADKAPVLPSSNVEPKALGISATMPENIISDIPFPIPLEVICSPSHIKKVVPATREIVKLQERFIPAFKVSKILKNLVNKSLLRGF